MSELELFAAALGIAEAPQRSTYLDGACGADTVLRLRLEVLLLNHEQAGRFLATPAAGRLPVAVLAAHDRAMRARSWQNGDDTGHGVAHGSQRATRGNPGDDDGNETVLDFLQPSPKPGTLGRLRHYEVLEVIGQGSFGTVVRAFDEKLHRMVAIKVMTPRLALTSPARKHFVHEARSSAAIRHENVVAIHAIEEQPIPFLVMEYVAGETLQQKIDRTGPLNPADAVRIAVQIAHGLTAAHALGKVHRDIKPANILLEHGNERVQITDFGLARAAGDASLKQSGFIAGTPLYMAPEQAQGLMIDQRADLFSLGSVLYMMCSGRPPFRAATMLAVFKRVAEDTPQPLREIMPEVPERLAAIITRLHAKKPEERFQSAKELANALGKCLREPSAAGVAPSRDLLATARAVGSAPRHWRGRRVAIATAALCVMALLGLGLTEVIGVTTLGRAAQRLLSRDAGRIVSSDSDQGPLAEGDPDRRGAEYALAIGGDIEILQNGMGRTLWAGSQVPGEAFDLIVVSFFRNQNLTDGGLDHFKGCKYLAVVDLEKTRVTPAKVLEMKRALPGCRIEWDGDIALLPATPDRRAAELVLSNGGTVTIKGGGMYRAIHTRSALPDGKFDLRAVNWLQDQKVGDAELAIFRNCHRLQGLALGGTNVSDAGLVNLAECLALTSLNLSDTQVSDIGLAHIKDLPSLTHLQLSSTRVTDAGLAYFKGRGNLKGLSLNATKITDTGLASLKDCRNLTHLDLGDTQVSDEGLSHLKEFKNLARLGLAGTKVGDVGLANFQDCKNLSHLDLGGTRVSDAGLAYFKDCENLAFLALNQTHVGDAGLTHLKGCKSLNDLNLANSRVSDAGLAQIIGYPQLYSINVKGTKVTVAGVKKLAGDVPACRIEWDGGVIAPTVNVDPDRRVAEWLQSPPGVTVHVIADGQETAAFSRAHLPKSPFQLRRLAVDRHPKVADESLTLLGGLRHLTHLTIRNCPVTDAVLDCFKDCRELRELQLPGTAVTDAGVARLVQYPKLRYLNLKQTAVSEAALQKLAMALPQCQVEWNGGVIEPR